jgi:hypothetical protein
MTRPAHIARLVEDDDDQFAAEDSGDRYFNRELSWLAFNRRVLEEACNEAHPLLERVRFLSISGSNLDEFFMVRVAGLKGQLVQDVDRRSADGMTSGQQLAAIVAEADELIESQRSVWRDPRFADDRRFPHRGGSRLAAEPVPRTDLPDPDAAGARSGAPVPVHVEQGAGGDVRSRPPVGSGADPRADHAAQPDATLRARAGRTRPVRGGRVAGQALRAADLPGV